MESTQKKVGFVVTAVMTQNQQVRYSDEDLEEFKGVILKKLEKARANYSLYLDSKINSNSGDEFDPTFKRMEQCDPSVVYTDSDQMAEREAKFIKKLENALIRIEDKTYGICRETGLLIPKIRLLAVPHATLFREVKENRK